MACEAKQEDAVPIRNSAEEKILGVWIHTNLEKRQSSRVLQLQAVLSKRL
jgi:hypothetical protein